jgi:hypothetical protein
MEENQRPCSHAVAMMMSAGEGYDVWHANWFGKCWHTTQWRDQYAKVVKRVAMHPSNWQQKDLVPAMLSLTAGRKRERPYVPTERPRKCGACGGFGHFAKSCKAPDMNVLVANNEKQTQQAVTDYIDLSYD